MDTIRHDALGVRLKKMAYELGVDLVGFANIERFAGAPEQMSPQGILPSARTVMVCGIHHPDATIELDGQPSAHISDSYGVQMSMNEKLDRISFRIGCFLEDMGFATVPIVSSNIWRYKEYKNLKAVFAPDMSHIYAAVAAGLTELGWHGLSMSPEYGTRNRFVSIITEAELPPTPLYRGDKLCDMCGECIRNCPTQAFTKEVRGVNNVRIEDKDNKFANKNLWRCAWSEHFQLDLDKPIPEVVDEKAIVDAVAREGTRGGTLGTCLKVCVPPNMRVEKPLYTPYVTRRNQFMPTGLPLPRKYIDQMLLTGAGYAADCVTTISAQTALEAGVDLTQMLPDARAAVIVAMRYRVDGMEGLSEKARAEIRGEYASEGERNMRFACMDIARMLDALGIAAISESRRMQRALAGSGLLGALGEGEEIAYSSVVLNHPLPDLVLPIEGGLRPLKGARDVKALAKEVGFDLCGIADAARMDEVAEQLRAQMGVETTLDSVDRNRFFRPFEPDTTLRERPVLGTGQYIRGGKSVIVLGIRYPYASLERAGQPPAEAVGPYVFAQFHVHKELSFAAMRLARALQARGYRAVFTHDLLGIGSEAGSPRGLHSASMNNSVEAVCAGLGQLAYNRTVYTSEYGVHQRFVAIVTDMELESDAVRGPKGTHAKCASCKLCVAACPTRAIDAGRLYEIQIGGVPTKLAALDRNRCKWASQYALTNRDGFEFGGSELDLAVPEIIDREALDEALRKRDPINKFRPTIVESCIARCPLANR